MNIFKKKTSKEPKEVKDDVVLESKIHKYIMTMDKRLKEGSFRYKSTIRLIAYLLIAIFVLFMPTFLEDSLTRFGSIYLSKFFVATFCALIIEIITRYLSEKKNEDKLEAIFLKEAASSEIQKRDEKLLIHIEEYLKLLGFEINNQDEIEKFLVDLYSNNNFDNQFKNLVRKEVIEIFSAYLNIKSDTGHCDDYRTQFVFAEYFCQMAKERFWATSTDRISDFQKQNYGYYKKMEGISRLEDMSKPLTINGTQIPRIGRIFIGDLNSFAADIINDYKYLFELYKMHLLLNKNNKDKEFFPVGFFLNDMKQYDEYFKNLNENERFIRDFMIVDNSLVYGREEDYSEKNLHLKLKTDYESIKLYESLFTYVWENSIPLAELVGKVFETGSWDTDEKKRDIFLNIVENIESKLEVIEDYSDMFVESGEMEGEKFFMKLSESIGKADNTIIAIDRANKKTNNFWKAWLQNEEYKSFYDSCIKAAKRNTKVQRLFVIENELSEHQKPEAKDFIKNAIESGLEIRFIDGSLIDPLELLYLSDFIITGISTDILSNIEEESAPFRRRINREKKEWIGFELLGEQYFIKSALSSTDNLVAKSLIIERAKKFNKLWNNENTIKLKMTTDQAINEFIDEIFNIKGVK